MSSEIFYDKAFIRVEEKYIPVVNHGSSNCFEFDSRGREIPEKTWSVLNHPYTERMLFPPVGSFLFIFSNWAAKILKMEKLH